MKTIARINQDMVFRLTMCNNAFKSVFEEDSSSLTNATRDILVSNMKTASTILTDMRLSLLFTIGLMVRENRDTEIENREGHVNNVIDECEDNIYKLKNKINEYEEFVKQIKQEQKEAKEKDIKLSDDKKEYNKLKIEMVYMQVRKATMDLVESIEDACAEDELIMNARMPFADIYVEQFRVSPFDYDIVKKVFGDLKGNFNAIYFSTGHNTKKDVPVVDIFEQLDKENKDLSFNYYYVEGDQYNLSDMFKNPYIKSGISSNGVKITNGAFDIMLIKSDYSCFEEWMPPRESKTNMPENVLYNQIKNNYKYLAKDGYIMIATVDLNISEKLAKLLDKNFTNIQIVKRKMKTINNYLTETITDFIYIIAQKKQEQDNGNFVEDFLASYKIKCTGQIGEIKPISLEPKNRIVTMFKDTKLHKYQEAYADLLCSKHSNIYDNIFKYDKKNDVERKPLLPMTIDLLGLSITSGAANGLIVEDNGCAHVVKGSVQKIIQQKNYFDEATEEDKNESIYNNSISISIFTPDGEFLQLV